MSALKILLLLISIQVHLIKAQSYSRQCFSVSDMVFIVSTSNVRAALEQRIKTHINQFISRYDISENATRVALVTSGKLGYVSFHLGQLPDYNTTRDTITAASLITPGNPPNLTTELEVTTTNLLSGNLGDRENTTNLLFIITDQTPEDYSNSSLQIINNTKNSKNILLFISMVSLEEARQWAPYASETDYVMDLDNMDLLTSSITPHLKWECLELIKEPGKVIDVLCLNSTCSTCRPSDGQNLFTCSCDGGALSSKYCYQQKPVVDPELSSRPRCRSGEGDTEVSVMTVGGSCDAGAIIDSVCPGFGPEAGGTDVYVWGRGFGDNVTKVFLWPFPCYVLYNNDTFLHCVSSPIEGTDAHFSSLSLQIETSTGCKLRNRGAFVYYHNPRIKQVQPTTSLVGGGFSTTVTGENLNNVANMILEITAVNSDSRHMFVSMCNLVDETTATCLFPGVYLPGVLWQNSNMRSKRNAAQERQAQQEILDEYKFYIGFKMDGVKTYKNMSKVSSTDGMLSVYLDPEVDSFPDDDGRPVFNYRPGWPDKMSSITLRGIGFITTPGADNLKVTIGSGSCDITDKSDDYIVCVPPDDEPSQPTVDDLHILNVEMFSFRVSPGYVRYDTSVWNNTTSRSILIVVIILAVLVAIFLTVFGVFCLRKKLKKRKEEKDWIKENGSTGKDLSQSEYSDYLIGEYLDPHTTLPFALSGDLKAKVESCRLDPSKVETVNLLSRGSHGLIYSGWLLNNDKERIAKVRIKTYDHDVPFRHIKEFLEDATQLKELDHQRVQGVAGVVLGERVPIGVTQYSEQGDLKGYLMGCRKNPEDFSLKNKMEICIDVCSGMKFISDNGIVHEDLAARNCVVDSDLRVKVADATLSRDLYELEYYRPGEKARALPVKWMPPEALEHQLFSSKGDVWSFGVLMWEVFTMAATPYPEVQNSDMKKHIRTGSKLQKPDTTPVALYTLMMHCWSKEPNKRPNFGGLTERLNDVKTDKPALNKTSFLPLDHFKIPDATTSVSIDTGVTLSSDKDVTESEKNVTSAQNGDLRQPDSVLISPQHGDTRL